MTSPTLPGLRFRLSRWPVGQLRSTASEVEGHIVAHHLSRAALLFGWAGSDELFDQFVLADRELGSAAGGHDPSVQGGYPL
jgi:hypothetical protein